MRLLASSLAFLSLVQIVNTATGTDFTVERYWQLTQAQLNLASLEWQDRIASAERSQGNRETLVADSATISAQYAEKHNELLATFEITRQAFLHFGSDHSREIESYLDEHPSVKEQLTALRQTIQALVRRFDAIADPILKKAR